MSRLTATAWLKFTDTTPPAPVGGTTVQTGEAAGVALTNVQFGGSVNFTIIPGSSETWLPLLLVPATRSR